MIVDSVGGGDSFGGGLIYALSEGYSAFRTRSNLQLRLRALKHTVEGDYNGQVSVDEVKA